MEGNAEGVTVPATVSVPEMGAEGPVISRERWEALRRLRGEGQSVSQIARVTGLDRKTVRAALAKGKSLGRRVQTGYDPETGQPVYEEETLDYSILPQIVVVVDELAPRQGLAMDEHAGSNLTGLLRLVDHILRDEPLGKLPGGDAGLRCVWVVEVRWWGKKLQ